MEERERGDYSHMHKIDILATNACSIVHNVCSVVLRYVLCGEFQPSVSVFCSQEDAFLPQGVDYEDQSGCAGLVCP